MRLVKSEWLKLIYVRAHWGLIVGATLISVIPVVITPFIISNDSELFGFGERINGGVPIGYVTY